MIFFIIKMSIGQKVALSLYKIYKSGCFDLSITRGIYYIYIYITDKTDATFHYVIQVFALGQLISTIDGCIESTVTKEKIENTIEPIINKIIPLNTFDKL